MINPLQIGLKVKTLRQTQNMTQEDLGEIVGVLWRTISNLERGLALPKLQLIYDMAQYFDVSMDKLLNNKITTNKPISRVRTENRVTKKIQS